MSTPLTSAPTDATSAPIGFRGVEYRAAKRFLHATHRICSPEETIERVRPLYRAAGITRVADVTGLDRIGIPVVLAMRPNAPTLANASGKGFTLAAATASAVMEGFEFHHAEEARVEPVTTTWRELDRSGLAIPVDELPLANASLFHPDYPERWAIGWDIARQREVAIPFESVGLGRPAARYKGRLTFQVGSNGLASGNHFLEAVGMGLAETIERDAVALVKLKAGDNYARLPRLDLTTIQYASVLDLIERLQGCGLNVALCDCTIDTQLPTYAALIFDESIPSAGKFAGYGSHLDPEIAMVRALTEAVQSRVVYVAGSRDDLMWLEHIRLHREPAEQLWDVVRTPGELDAGRLESRATSSFEGDVQTMIDSLARVGVESVVVVDLTRPEFGIPVVRVFVPGLEGYRGFGWWAPGRRAQAMLDEERQ